MHKSLKVAVLLIGVTSMHHALYAPSEKGKLEQARKGEFKDTDAGPEAKKQYDLGQSKLDKLKLKMNAAHQQAQNAWSEAKRLAEEFRKKVSSENDPGRRMLRSLEQTVAQMKKDWNKPIDSASASGREKDRQP